MNEEASTASEDAEGEIEPSILDQMEALDEDVFEEVASWHSPFLDDVMPKLSIAASYSRLWAGIGLLIWAFGGKRARESVLTGFAAIGVTSAVANITLKGLTRRRRPQSQVPEDRRLEHPDSSSFPSGHSASAAAFSGVIGAEIPILHLPMNALAGAVGFSRVYTGVHYPGDVLAGWALGKVIAAGVVNTHRIVRGRSG